MSGQANDTMGAPGPLVFPLPTESADSFGALLIGTFLGVMLYGMAMHQLYRYNHLYPKDGLWLKALVYTTMALETAHVVLTMHLCYVYIVTDFLEPALKLFSIESGKLLPLFSGLIIFVSQLFFAVRVYTIGPQYQVFTLMTILLLAAELGFFIVATFFIFTASNFEAFHQQHVWLISAGTGIAMGTDLLLTALLAYGLHFSRAMRRSIDGTKALDIIIAYGINTGLLSSIFAIAAFVVVFPFEDYLVPTCMFILSTRLYANTLLGALNTRPSKMLRGVVGVSEARLFGRTTDVTQATGTAVDSLRMNPSYAGSLPSTVIRFKSMEGPVTSTDGL
ncbi:hypothetical protein K466DRAFT_582979 [Polyporus arcularius HHB13444]|uniref:DUF6534 domain-containing protein n=1 Tax=Polyporus arcularius HHB13444 TaxID=1314778 RepID=A0A5C3PU17_9APHY|nr:hypothetical protein K466DRAFT_582979 [Polyporus arcularius HHB13444]